MNHMRPRFLWLAAPILATAGAPLAGCGLDNGLICGPECDPDASDARPNVPGNGASDSSADVAGDGSQQGESGSGDDGQAGDSTTGVDVGAMPMDSTAGDSSDGGGGGAEGGCQVCGLATCCTPLQCGSNNTSCCSGLTGACGGDKGSCCSGLVCTTGQQCAASCKATGSCATLGQNDCCRGMSYCDMGTGSCLACRPQMVPCTLHDQCCSGHCGMNDAGANFCSGGN